MDSPNPIVNLGDLAKPATVLIEKISDAIGGIYRPYQIRKVAEAEADAERIRAVTQIEITDLQRRAMTRFITEEAKKQSNIESITTRALPQVTEDAKPQDIEDDWVTHFFDRGRLISDADMQKLWAKILAGQANAPGSYTKRTIDILANLEKDDAITFAKLCGFAFKLDDLIPLVYKLDHKIYNEQGIDFGSLSHLESLGLIHFDAIATYARTGLRHEGHMLYFETPVWIGFKTPAPNEMEVGHVLLTHAGKELAPVGDAKPVDGFVDYVRDHWKAKGYRIEPETQEPSPDNPQAETPMP